MLAGKVAFVAGVASKHSIATAVANAWQRNGAKVIVGIQSDRFRRTAEGLFANWGESPRVVECDVSNDDSLRGAFEQVSDLGDGRLDALAHCIAFAPATAMRSPLLHVSRDDFSMAMDVSAYSLVALARHAAPLLEVAGGGSIMSMSYLGAARVVPDYSVMGPAKAALEATARYLAFDLADSNVRVNCISAGPLNTLAARGIRNFTGLQEEAARRAPLKQQLSTKDVGDMATFLASDMATAVTAQTLYVDCGFSSTV